MALKKRIQQLESLLDWESEEGGLPVAQALVNYQIDDKITLREVRDKTWALEFFEKKGEDRIQVSQLFISHVTLIQLGLKILEAVKITTDR